MDYKHSLYDETMDIAEDAAEFLSRETEDQADDITRYRIRETDEQKEQRVRLTNTITSVAISPVYAYFEEVKRTDGVKYDVMTSNSATKERVDGLHAQYYGEKGLHEYLHGALLHYNKYDPNAWIIFERRLSADGNTVDEFYPVEVSSHEAVDFGFDETGILQYLVAKFTRSAKRAGKAGTLSLDDYYMYGPGYAWHFAQVNPDVPDRIDYEALGYVETPVKNKLFMARLWENGTVEVPAIRCGAYYSGKHRRKICESPVADAYPILQDLQRDKSYLDTSKTIHTFPKLFEYVRPCEHVDEESNLLCDGGYYGGVHRTESICKACGGAGYIVHGSEQDVIRLLWPRNAEEIIDLQKLSHYQELPFEVVRFLREEVDRARRDVFMAVFNQETVDKAMTVQTATEIRIEYDKIYNKLLPFANRISVAWEKATRIAHQYFGDSTALADMNYPFDFKLKNIEELTAEYSAAKAAGLSYDILWAIQQDIIRKQYRNMPDRVNEIRAFEQFRPWKEKTPEEIAVIIQRRDEADPDRVLWENWSRIVTEVQQDRGDNLFSAITDTREQRRILYAKAAEVAALVQYSSSGNPFDAMFAPDPQTVDNGQPQ